MARPWGLWDHRDKLVLAPAAQRAPSKVTPRTGVLKPLSPFAPQVRTHHTPACACTLPKCAHICPPQSYARQIPVSRTLFPCPTSSLSEVLGHLLGSPPPTLNSLPLWVQTASPSESMAGTIGLTAREGRRGVTGTCRTPSPRDSCRSSESPAPSTRWSV